METQSLHSNLNCKYIFVTGGVASSLGKGILAASLGKLLQARGYNVINKKLDPYLNIDPDTLNPYEHGECYVTNDGHVADLDLGHYERFLNVPTSRNSNVTTGRIYQSVITKERAGAYNGKTVQVIPHITNEIKEVMMAEAKASDKDIITIIEIGGTVGDIEGLPYIEAVRQMRWEHPHNTLCIHLTYVPYLAAAGEIKTKPTQHSVKALQELGVQPDVVVLRTEHDIDEDTKRKVSLFCNVTPDAVIESKDCKSIYDVPIRMQEEGLDTVVVDKLGLSALTTTNTCGLEPWNDFLHKKHSATEEVHIAIVGKYVQLQDAYKSIHESLYIAAAYNDKKLRLHNILADDVTDETAEALLHCVPTDKGDFRLPNAVLVAPGFGSRGIEGNIAALHYIREHNIPCLGIGMGAQCMVQEVANLLHITEPVLIKNDTLRLGAYTCTLQEGSKARAIYQANQISERHRHGYEINNKHVAALEKGGMIATGVNPGTGLVEIIEVPQNDWYIGVQFHPEYHCTVLAPHPLFLSFIAAATASANK